MLRSCFDEVMQFDVIPLLDYTVFYDLLFCVQPYVICRMFVSTGGLKPVQIVINTYASVTFILSLIQSLNGRMHVSKLVCGPAPNVLHTVFHEVL
jgi:hypothetical protein